MDAEGHVKVDHNDAVITITDLVVAYGRRRAVGGVSLALSTGVTGLLGPNGAGKTSLMRAVAGLKQPSAGRVSIEGVPDGASPVVSRRRIGFVPERTGLPAEMSVEAFLRHAAEAKQVPRRQRADEVARAMEDLQVVSIRDRVIGNLSKGYRQRVGFAQALIGDPPVLILDEPTSGIDPTTVTDLYELIESLGRSRVVLISSHVMADVRAVCDDVVVIAAGEMLWKGPLAELSATGERVRTRVVLSTTGAGAGLRAPWPSSVTVNETRRIMSSRVREYIVECRDGAHGLSAALSSVVAQGHHVVSMEPLSDGLTDLFREAVQRQAAVTMEDRSDHGEDDVEQDLAAANVEEPVA